MKLNGNIQGKNKNPYGLFPSQANALQELSDWWNSNVLEHTLKGVAGTGKTFLLKTFLETVVNKSYTITAPTHKALRVAERHIGIQGLTLQSLHGLKPDVNLETFDIDNLAFNTIGTPKMEHFSLVVIDESSMINSDLFELNRRNMRIFNCKILYVGDPLQLPPVKEKESKVFTTVEGITELTEIIRQGKDNPLLNLFELLREDIKNRTSNCLTYMSQNRKQIVRGKGYEVLNAVEYEKKLLEYFSNDKFYKDINFVRATAFTNTAINGWNNIIRNGIHNTEGRMIIMDDLITSYSTIVEDGTNAVILTNSEDYIIGGDNIRPYKNEYGISTYCVIFKSASTLKDTKMLQVVNHNDILSLDKYTEILTKLRNNAKAKGGRAGWYPYHKFKNQVLCMIDLEVANLRLSRDLDYGYALTTHKLQGSTFDNIFIDGQDICSPMSKYGKRYPTDIEFRNRLLYVALSRAKNCAYIKF